MLLLALVLLCCIGCSQKGESDELQTLVLEELEEEEHGQVLADKDMDPDVQTKDISGQSEDISEAGSQDVIYVFVCGAVRSPGVYALESTARVYEAIVLAGGICEEGSAEYVNQAQKLEDGEKIYIPTKEEVQQGIAGENHNLFIESDKDTEKDSKVNINTASVEELKTLPGIGDTRAKSIIKYREEHGDFQVIEDLMRVEGIKEGVFEKMKDSIKVNAGS